MKTFPTIIGVAALAFSAMTSVANAAFLPVCDRTTQVKKFIEETARKTCENITETDLATIQRVAVEDGTIKEFKADDFSGLTGLEILNIRSNKYTELPEGLLKDLVNLKTLVIISTTLRHYPDDSLAYNPNIENLHLFRNKVRTISESVLSRIEKMPNLLILDFDDELGQAEKDRLRKDFPLNGKVELTFY